MLVHGDTEFHDICLFWSLFFIYFNWLKLEKLHGSYKSLVSGFIDDGLVDLTGLTSKKMIFEHTKDLFKKETEVVDVIPLETIKSYNGELQVKQHVSEIKIQTTEKDFTIYTSGIIEASKLATKIVSAATGTTIVKRGSEKVKGALNLVDDTLGIDTRGMIKGVSENGIAGTLLHGIKKKK